MDRDHEWSEKKTFLNHAVVRVVDVCEWHFGNLILVLLGSYYLSRVLLMTNTGSVMFKVP